MESPNMKQFTSWRFYGIYFCKIDEHKYTAWSVHDSFNCSPEFLIGPNASSISLELRKIVETYLGDHPELGLTINDFL